MPFSLSASVTWFLAPHAAHREACSRKTRQRCRCVARVFGFPAVSLSLASWPLSGVSEDCTSTLENHLRATYDAAVKAILQAAVLDKRVQNGGTELVLA